MNSIRCVYLGNGGIGQYIYAFQFVSVDDNDGENNIWRREPGRLGLQGSDVYVATYCHVPICPICSICQVCMYVPKYLRGRKEDDRISYA